jgi:predicted nucleic acid-binding protein
MSFLFDCDALLALGYIGHVNRRRVAEFYAAHLGEKQFIGFLADDLGASTLPSYVKHPRDTTDGHLLALAERHNLRLLTLDKRIPGALVIS